MGGINMLKERYVANLFGAMGSKPKAIQYTIQDILAMMVCKIIGHKLVNDEIADPEVGPQPDIYCIRCGKTY
jgi:hypothetical protein